jgi:hypothetical protein
MSEAFEIGWLKEHRAQVALHYATLAVTLGGGGTEDEISINVLMNQISAHARNLKAIEDNICNIRKQRYQATDCGPVELKIKRNPTYEVAKPNGTYQAPPIYVPSDDDDDCEYAYKLGKNGCAVRP